MKSKTSTRIVSVVLLVAMIFSCMNLPIAAVSFNGESDYKTKTGILVAENYGSLNAYEKAILSSKALSGDSYSGKIPVNESLVTIDSENKTVTAAEASGSDGVSRWIPVSCEVFYKAADGNDKSAGTFEFENGKTTFTCPSESYHIDVKYGLYINAEETLQKRLLDAPAYLVGATINLNYIYGQRGSIDIIGDNIDSLYKLTTGELQKVYPGGMTATVYLEEGAARDAIISLKNETAANGGKLKLYNLILNYNSSANKVLWLANNAAEVKAEFESLDERFDAISSSDSSVRKLASDAEKFGFADEAEKMNEALDYLADVVSELANINAKYWAVEDLVDRTASSDEFAALNSAIASAIQKRYTSRVSEHGSETVNNPLLAGYYTVTKGVDQNKVEVTVKAKVVDKNSADSEALTTLGETKTESFVLSTGATEAEILEAIENSGIKADAKAAWDSEYGIDETNYDVIVEGVPSALSENVSVTVTYVPKTYSVTYNYETTSTDTVPYGYRITLAKHSDSAKSYDYTVNGALCREGSVYKVTGDTVLSRKEGKAVSEYNITAVIAGSDYPGSLLSAEEKAVITSRGLTDSSVWYRLPDQNANLVVVSSAGENKYNVTAADCFSGLLSGSAWKAVKGYIVDGDGKEVASFDITNGSAQFDYDGDFDHVRVEYSLTVPEIGASDIAKYINLPNSLVAEAAAQRKALADMMTDDLVKGLSEVYGSRLDMIEALSKDYSAEARAAVEKLIEECVDTSTPNESLYLYEYILNYQAQGLAFYYADGNAAKMAYQIETLRDCLNILWEDPEFQKDLEDPDISKYRGRLEIVKDDLQDVELVGVNENIDGSSEYLANLVAAIDAAAGKTSAHAVTGDIKLLASVTAAAPDTSSVSVTVNVVDKNGNKVYSAKGSRSFAADGAIGEDGVAKLEALIASLKSGYAIDETHYALTVEGTLPGADDTVSENMSVVYTWAPVRYTVKIDGEADQYIYPDGSQMKINLPLCQTPNHKYIYIIGSERITSTSYVIADVAALDALFGEVGGTLTITREDIDLNRDGIIDFVNKLNKAIADNGLTYTKDGRQCLMASFIPLEDENGNITVVFRVSPKNISGVSYKEVAADIANIFIDTYFDYIGIDGEVFWDKKVHLQSAIDAILNSGVSLDTVTEVIDENGNIKEITDEIPSLGSLTAIGNVNNGALEVSGKYINDVNILGGKIAATSLQFGSSAADAINVPFYITLEDFDLSASSLKSARKAVTDVRRYVNIEGADGELKLTVTSPESVYPYFMAALLVSGKADIENIGNIDMRDVLKYGFNLASPVISDRNLSVETIERTLLKAEKTVDLSSFKKLFSLARKGLSNLMNNVSEDGFSFGGTYNGTITYDIRQLLADKLGLSDTVLKLIAEANPETAGAEAAGVKANVEFTLTNVNTTYEAVIVDARAEGIKNKYRFVKDLDAVLPTLHKDATVVLLSDVTLDRTATFNNAAIIDLNGFTLKGNLVSNCTGNYGVSIIDTRIDTYGCGTVDGTLSGKFTVTGGKFTSDVSAMLKKGYVQDENGYVTNGLYTLTEDIYGNITVNISGDVIDDAKIPDLKAFAADLGADLIAKFYNSAEISVDGNKVYSVNINDLVGYVQRPYKESAKTLAGDLVACIDEAGLTSLINKALADVTDFGKVASAVENGEDILSYNISTKFWDVAARLEGSADDNYLTADVKPSENGKNFKVSVKLAENATAEQRKAIADIFKELDKTVTVNDLGVNIADIAFDGRKLAANYDGRADVKVDLSVNKDYAALIAVMVAYNTTGSLKDELVAAVNTYLDNRTTSELKTALEKVTVAQFVSAVKSVRRATVDKMLSSLGIESEGIASLENIYDRVLNVAAAALNRLDITGSSSRLSAFATEEFGTYEYEKSIRSIDLKGTLKLFDEDKAIVVKDSDGNVVLETDDLSEAFENRNDGDVLYINKAVTASSDITVSADVKIKNAANIDLGDYSIVLGNENAKVTSDSRLSVKSGLDLYEVVETEENGRYTYTLTLKAIIVISASGAEKKYVGTDLAKALKEATDGSTVYVNIPAVLGENVTLNASVEIVSASNIDFSGNKITLKTGKTLVSDSPIAANVAAERGYKINETVSGGKYTYKAKALVPTIAVPTVNVQPSGNIRGARVEAANKYIYLDTNPNGLSAANFKSLVTFATTNADTVTYEIKNNGSTLGTGALVPTGAKVTVTASNASGGSATVTYTVIILGDTNCNGRIESADATRIALHYAGVKTMTGDAFLAADANRNGKIESGDAVKIAVKYAYAWNDKSYASSLK